MKNYLLASSALLCLASPLKADFTHSPYIGLGIGGVNAQHSINIGEDLGGVSLKKNMMQILVVMLSEATLFLGGAFVLQKIGISLQKLIIF